MKFLGAFASQEDWSVSKKQESANRGWKGIIRTHLGRPRSLSKERREAVEKNRPGTEAFTPRHFDPTPLAMPFIAEVNGELDKK